MSVMCAVYVPEGIVVAADSRMTISFVNKSPNGSSDTKMFSVSDNAQKVVLLSKVHVGISACGIGILDDKTIADYIRVFEIEKVTDKDTVYDVASKLCDYCRGYEKLSKFYVMGYNMDEPFIFAVENDSCKRLNIKDGSILYGTAWNGEPVAINKMLNGEPKMSINFKMMPLKDAIDFAKFLIDTTINYQRFETRLKTCGGDVDVLILTKDDAFWYSHKVFKPVQ